MYFFNYPVEPLDCYKIIEIILVQINHGAFKNSGGGGSFKLVLSCIFVNK
jgi:hypothetical protein